MEHLRKLNTIRGLAALIVLVSHFSNNHNTWMGDYLGRGAGQIGVMLFFMLSGFLMSALYIARSPSYSNIRSYAVARAARVLPLFVVVIVISYITSFYSEKLFFKIYTNSDLVEHLLLLRGDSVLWTIPVELQFYLLFVLAWLLFSKSPSGLLITVTMVLILITVFPAGKLRGELLSLKFEFNLLFSLPYFLTGVVLGTFEKHRPRVIQFQHSMFLLVLIGILICYPQVFKALFGFPIGLWNSFELWGVLSTIFATLVFFTPDDSLVLSNRVGDFLGEISYSLYLLHLPVLRVVSGMPIENVHLKFLCFLLASVFVAYLSFKFVEKPSRQYLRHKYLREK